jgi:hypothetical protein
MLRRRRRRRLMGGWAPVRVDKQSFWVLTCHKHNATRPTLHNVNMYLFNYLNQRFRVNVVLPRYMDIRYVPISKQRWDCMDCTWMDDHPNDKYPGVVKRCNRILWPGKALEKTPRGVIPLACTCTFFNLYLATLSSSVHSKEFPSLSRFVFIGRKLRTWDL